MKFEKQYLSYSEYLGLGGELDEMPFNLLEFEARKKIDKRTQARLVNVTDIPEEVRLCVFRLINAINEYSKSQARGISSENTDGYSVSYSDIQTVINEKASELEDIISSDLSYVAVNNVPVLYLGVI